ncbi:MAG TPA: hypothetical protein ENJ41_05080 [Oceanospirillales bacterium]|nr:hypothetical protein [Oceanospirillales bacterium]
MKKIKHLIDPVFLRDSGYSYVDCNHDELATILCFALGRNQADLILHQQRIELYAKTRNQNLLFSAIVDLFIALGKKGTNYKNRIFDKYREILSTKQTIILTRSLASELAATTPISNLQESRLSNGNQGRLLSTNDL